MKKMIITGLALMTFNSYAFEIFVRASKEELKNLPKQIESKDCRLNVSKKRMAELSTEIPKQKLLISLTDALRERGYTLNLVDYQIKLGIHGPVLESDDGPGTGKDIWSPDDLVGDFSIHVAKKGTYVSFTNDEALNGKEIYSGKTIRDYCEMFVTFGKASAEKELKTMVDLRLTKRAFLGQTSACKKTLKQTIEILPTCIIKH